MALALGTWGTVTSLFDKKRSRRRSPLAWPGADGKWIAATRLRAPQRRRTPLSRWLGACPGWVLVSAPSLKWPQPGGCGARSARQFVMGGKVGGLRSFQDGTPSQRGEPLRAGDALHQVLALFFLTPGAALSFFSGKHRKER